MKYTHTQEQLMDAMIGMDVIDCHEHLPSEQSRLATPQDIFTLFSHYTRHDLFSAGMDSTDQNIGPWDGPCKVYNGLFDYSVPLEKRWAIFKPYWDRIRFGSYARAAILTARMVYNIDEISDRTYQELSHRIAAANTPGLYRRILCDKCRIRASLTQGQMEGCEYPLVPVWWAMELTNVQTAQGLEQMTADTNINVRSMDDFDALLEHKMDAAIRAGAVGIKLTVHQTVAPDRKAAAASLKQLLDGKTLPDGLQTCEPLKNYLTHTIIDMAADRNLVVAMHAGIWGDFRQIDCKHLLTLAPLHPRAQFDLYHLGMPSVRDAIVVAKNLPNVFLNLCWTHIISQVQACSGIDELLDQVPVNKVLAFGGDYHRPVEKVVGHLHMAREDFACVFGRRIDRGEMGVADAKAILKLWFWDNPLTLYSRVEIC